MARLKNQTSVCLVRRNFLFARRRARQLRATPSAADASRYDAPESRGVDRRQPRCEPLRPVPARDLSQARTDEQKRRHVFVYRSHATDRPPFDRAPAREVTRDLPLARPSRRKAAFDRGQCSPPPLSYLAAPFQQPLPSRENRIQETLWA